MSLGIQKRPPFVFRMIHSDNEVLVTGKKKIRSVFFLEGITANEKSIFAFMYLRYINSQQTEHEE